MIDEPVVKRSADLDEAEVLAHPQDQLFGQARLTCTMHQRWRRR
jgi:hypothetical protein